MIYIKDTNIYTIIMRRYVFKVCINVESLDEVQMFLEGTDGYLCLSGLMPESPLGYCLGVIEFDIDGVPVVLALHMVNDELKRPWIRQGGIIVDIEDGDFREQLYNTAKNLIAGSAS